MTDRLAAACRQFEAILLKEALIEAGVGKAAGFAGGSDPSDDLDNGTAADAPQTDIMQSLFADSLAQAIAAADSSGFSRVLARQFEKADHESVL